MRITDPGSLALVGALCAIACSCPAPKQGTAPANPSLAQTEPSPRASAEPAPSPLAPQVVQFADQACKCQEKACADEVTRAFNDWAAAHRDAQGSDQDGGEIAAQVARMAACTDRFATPLPLQGQPCSPSGECAEGLTCLRYYGIAGARGPQFTSCEIPCVKQGCPDGQSCVTIADGPGRVCRPN